MTPDSDSSLPQDDFLEAPSKSSRKREMHALQEIGEQLVALSAERLRTVPLPEDLREAVFDAQRFTQRGARRRQLQYIGKLMRNVEVEPILEKLDAFNGTSKEEAARLHRLERLRTDFLEDEQAASKIIETWPQADLQHLRTLRRNALKEREQGRPPKAFRELFRALRELDGET